MISIYLLLDNKNEKASKNTHEAIKNKREYVTAD